MKPGTTVRFEAHERERYGRHFLLPEIGPGGQQRLKNSSVLVVGAGGLGAPILQYLAAAGTGRIGIVDDDLVELSNLQRQVLFSTSRTGKQKTEEAGRRIHEINPLVVVRPYPVRLGPANALEILRGFDVVADATDNFPTRYLLNDACRILGIPLVHGGLHRFEGQVTVFHPAGGPCYRCFFPRPPAPGLVPDCGEAGIMGALPGVIGSLQAVEIIKIIVGCGKILKGRLLIVDALTMSFRETKFSPDPGCVVCGPSGGYGLLGDYEEFCGLKYPAGAGEGQEISPGELRSLLDGGEDVILLDVREEGEYALSNIGGVLIPLGELAARLGELDSGTNIVVHCKTGRRSARAAEILRRAGFKSVKNLTGGIAAWRMDIDSSLPGY